MRRILLAGAATLAASLSMMSANAADLQRPIPNPMPTKAPPYVAPEYDWTGFYVGINGGGGWGRGFTELSHGFDISGALVGGTAGYNVQLGHLVLGVEGDIDWSDLKGSTSANGCVAGCSVENKWLGTGRGRVGYAFGTFLPYVTGGVAVGDVSASAAGFSGMDSTQVGWTAGGGLEYGLTRNWSAKVEYLHVDLGRFNCGFSCGPTANDDVGFRADTVRGGLNLRF